MAEKVFRTYLIFLRDQDLVEVKTKIIPGVGEYPKVSEGRYGVIVYSHLDIDSYVLYPWHAITKFQRKS